MRGVDWGGPALAIMWVENISSDRKKQVAYFSEYSILLRRVRQPGRRGERPGRRGERPGRRGERPGRRGERPGRRGERPGRKRRPPQPWKDSAYILFH